MRHLVAVASLAALLGASAAHAGVAVGDPAPPLDVKEYVNTEPVTLEELKDSVVVIELFRTTSKVSCDQEARLEELATQFGERGLVILTVTNEERKLVDAFVALHKPKHGILIEKGDSATTWGLVKGFPTAYVIGPDGKIAWSGNWADKAKDKIELLLAKAKRSPRLPARLAAARDAAEAGRYAEAHRTLDAELKAGTVTDAEKPLVQRMIVWIGEQLQKQLVAAAELSQKGELYEAAAEFERISKDYAELDAGKRAADALKQILSQPAAKREVDAGKALAAAIEQAKNASPQKAISLYKAVAAKWKDTQAARKAGELVAELEKKPPK